MTSRRGRRLRASESAFPRRMSFCLSTERLKRRGAIWNEYVLHSANTSGITTARERAPVRPSGCQRSAHRRAQAINNSSPHGKLCGSGRRAHLSEDSRPRLSAAIPINPAPNKFGGRFGHTGLRRKLDSPRSAVRSGKVRPATTSRASENVGSAALGRPRMIGVVRRTAVEVYVGIVGWLHVQIGKTRHCAINRRCPLPVQAERGRSYEIRSEGDGRDAAGQAARGHCESPPIHESILGQEII